MKRFCWKCHCGRTIETETPGVPTCECGRNMIRDWKAEAATPTYHPTKGKS